MLNVNIVLLEPLSTHSHFMIVLNDQFVDGKPGSNIKYIKLMAAAL